MNKEECLEFYKDIKERLIAIGGYEDAEVQKDYEGLLSAVEEMIAILSRK